MNVKSDPNSGAERFMKISVTISEVQTDFDVESLDRVGKRTIRSRNNPVSFKAIANIEWKDETAREDCKRYQESRPGRRWKSVLSYAERMKAGEIPEVGAVFLLPSGTLNQSSQELEPVDGTRRLMAFCEAGIKKIDVIVVQN
jgi:hypothetical protein